MEPLTAPELEELTKELADLVGKYSRGSAFRGLLALASGFMLLSDVYAKPNAENPLGMVDDPQHLRDILAQVIKTGSLQGL